MSEQRRWLGELRLQAGQIQWYTSNHAWIFKSLVLLLVVQLALAVHLMWHLSLTDIQICLSINHVKTRLSFSRAVQHIRLILCFIFLGTFGKTPWRPPKQVYPGVTATGVSQSGVTLHENPYAALDTDSSPYTPPPPLSTWLSVCVSLPLSTCLSVSLLP